MASANIGGGSGGRRKSLDAEINLVPFIDLLSMCICFLLMTAVWVQLGSVQVKQANGTEGAAETKDTLDLDVKFLSESQVTLSLKSKGRVVKSYQVQGTTAADLATAFDKQVQDIQTQTKSQGEISAVMLTPKAGVSYGSMISIMDVLRKNRLVNLGVVPVNPLSGG